MDWIAIVRLRPKICNDKLNVRITKPTGIREMDKSIKIPVSYHDLNDGPY